MAGLAIWSDSELPHAAGFVAADQIVDFSVLPAARAVPQHGLTQLAALGPVLLC